MVGGLARPDDELPARVAMPSPPRAFTPRFLLAFCRHDHSERETTASEARRDEARRGARFPRITASRETWSRRNRTERQRSAANRLRSASRLPLLDARSSPRGGHTGLVFFSLQPRLVAVARLDSLVLRLLLASYSHGHATHRSVYARHGGGTDNETDDSTLARHSRSIISRMRIAMTPPTRQRRAPFECAFIFVPCAKRFVRGNDTSRPNVLDLGWSAWFVLRGR